MVTLVAWSGGETVIRLWSVETLQPRGTLQADWSQVSSAALSPDGRTVAAGSFDSSADTVGATVSGSVAGIAGGADVAELAAWRCFSQQGQAYVRRTCSITMRDAGS